MNYKLNNRGWGLSTMIGFVAIFFIFILVFTILAYKSGIEEGSKNKNIYTNTTTVTP